MRGLLHRLLRTTGFDLVRWTGGGYGPGVRESVAAAAFARRSSSYRSALAGLLRDTDVDLVLDVGANRGQFALEVRDAGYAGDIISFEPGPGLSGLREASADDPRWTYEATAVGDRSEERPLTISDGGDLNSFLTPSKAGLSVIPSFHVHTQEAVAVRRLDEIVGDRGSRIFLKSDTNGWDLHVLKGAEGILDRVVAIQVELMLFPFYEDAEDYVEILWWLRERGFTPEAHYDVLTIDGRLHAADCLLRRT